MTNSHRDKLLEEFKSLLSRCAKEKNLNGSPWKRMFGGPTTYKNRIYQELDKAEVTAYPEITKRDLENFTKGVICPLYQHPYFTDPTTDRALPGSNDPLPLFYQDLQKLRAHFSQETEVSNQNRALIHDFRAGQKPETSLPLTALEARALAKIEKRLGNQASLGRLGWMSRWPFDGEDILFLGLGHRLANGTLKLPSELRGRYQRLLHVTPGISRSHRQDTETLLNICDYLGVKQISELGAQLAQQGILLVVSSADTLSTKELNSLTKMAAGEGIDPVMRVIILFRPDFPISFPAGSDSEFQLQSNRAFPQGKLAVPRLNAKEQRDLERFDPPEQTVWKEFTKLLDHYDRLQTATYGEDQCAKTIGDPSEYRERLAEWAFSEGAQGPGSGQDEVRTCDLRMRAFLSSNRQMITPDTSAGFRALSGLPVSDWPAEISVYHRTVSLWLASLPRNGAALELLRFISTGSFWVRRTTLDHLCKIGVTRTRQRLKQTTSGKMKAEKAEKLFVTTPLAGRDEILKQLIGTGIIRHDFIVDDMDDAEELYMVPFGFRAIVQDHWRQDKPANRALTHLAIANRLYELDRDRKDVLLELPIGPIMSGRGRLFYLLEVIRHLVRASDQGPQDVEDLDPETKPAIGFAGDLGKRVLKGTPERTFAHFRAGLPGWYLLDVAYHELFSNEMNDLPSGRDTLARRYGVYRVMAEALQLLEQAGYRPLDPRERNRFQRLQALSAFEMGALFRAQHLYEKLDTRLSAPTDPFEELFKDPQGVFFAKIGKLDVEIEMLELASARETLKETEGHLETARSNWRDLRRKLDVEDRDEELRSWDRSVAARQSRLMLLSDEPSNALERLQQSIDEELRIRGEAPDPEIGNALHIARARNARGNVGHRYIEAIIANNDPKQIGLDPDEHDRRRTQLKLCRVVCMDNEPMRYGRANLHSSLGFRIQYASLQRILGNGDEGQVELINLRDFLFLHGCSVRTLFAFQIEAGQSLLAQGRALRALALYLLPCFERAERLGYLQWMQQALAPAINATREALALAPAQNWRDLVKKELLKGVSANEFSNLLAEQGATGQIPQQGFSWASLEQAAKRFKDRAKLAALEETLVDWQKDLQDAQAREKSLNAD